MPPATWISISLGDLNPLCYLSEKSLPWYSVSVDIEVVVIIFTHCGSLLWISCEIPTQQMSGAPMTARRSQEEEKLS